MKNRWINLLFFLLIVLISALTYRLFFLEQTLEAARLMINILKPLSHLLVIMVMFVILRSLVKLYFAHRKRVTGYRLQTKVILSLLPLSILPSIALFIMATRFVDDFLMVNTADTAESKLMTYADEFVQDHFREIGRLHLRHADTLLSTPPTDLPDYLQRYGIDAIEIYRGESLQHSAVSPELDDDIVRRIAETTTQASSTQYDQYADGLLIARFTVDRGPLRLHIVDTLRSDITERYLYIRDSARFLEVNRRKNRQLTGLNQTLLLMTTFVILFGGIWTALALSKRFLDAFKVLITGARQVSEGNLGTRLHLETGDEMEDVLDAFNTMTQRLQQNQTDLEEKAKETSRVNEELTSQIQYTQTILQQTNAGVLSTDNLDRISTHNPAVLRILEMERMQPGVKLTDWLDPARHAALLHRWQEFKNEGTSTQYTQLELRNEESGRVRYVATTMVPLENEETTFGNLIILEDLTQLMNAQKLAAWREVAKRVAHEIKNPLTPIQLSIQRIERKARKGAPDLVAAIHSAHETIMNETDLLKNLVNEFSTFAKMPGPTPAATDLTELIHNMQETYAPVYPDIELVCNLEPIRTTCDAGQMRQVFSNLINNAATASDGQGVITVTMKQTDGRLHISVSDTGKGIPTSDHEKVFLPYYSKSPKGTGLGLAIVKRIIEDHQGTIRVRNNHPKGTVFDINLPLT